MKSILFGLEDIRAQLSEDSIKVFEGTIFMARETGNPQLISSPTFIRPIIVWPSGKMSFKRDKYEPQMQAL